MDFPKDLLADLNKYKIDLEKLSKDQNIKNFINEIIIPQYKEKELINKIFNSAPITISCVNKNFEYVKVNEKMAQIVQKDPSYFVGKTVGETTKDPAFGNFINDLFKSKNNNLSRELKVVKGTTEISYVVNGSKYSNGEYAVIIGMDISLLKEYEKNAAFSEKMKDLGTLCSGIAHEINNPLQAINTIVDLVDLELEESIEENRSLNKEESLEIIENMQEIKTIVKQASAITGSLRSFSRNTQDEELTEVCLEMIVKDAMLLIKNKITTIDFNCNFECDKQTKFLAREVQLIQVLVNFMSNGVDAIKKLSKDQQWMKFTIKEQNNNIEFHFIDGGNGIPEEVQRKMFEAFFTTKETRQGTGLGLSICKDIVEKHKGQIQINNDSENTHFIIKVPKLIDN